MKQASLKAISGGMIRLGCNSNFLHLNIGMSEDEIDRSVVTSVSDNSKNEDMTPWTPEQLAEEGSVTIDGYTFSMKHYGEHINMCFYEYKKKYRCKALRH